jgi:hypothetical protein
MPTIAILGTMDTKGVEHGFVADCIRQQGHGVLIIDVGTLEAPKITPDISREEVAAAAGVDLAALVAKRDRGESVTAMSRGAPVVLARLAEEERIDGVISLGGGGGTAIATAAMRALPVGFPKLMVSTLASGNTAPYVGVKDIVTAYILGVEVAARLGAVAQGGFHQVGFHPTGTVGVFASALVAGKLMGLSEQQLAMAQGITLSMAAVPIAVPPPPPSEMTPSMRFSSASLANTIGAPRDIAATASPRSRLATSAARSTPAALATSSRLISGVIFGASSVPTSMIKTPCPCWRMQSATNACSTPFVSMVPRMAMVGMINLSERGQRF